MIVIPTLGAKHKGKKIACRLLTRRQRATRTFQMVLTRKVLARCLLLLAVLSSPILVPKAVHALNGPQFIGFSAESTALAAAGHVAVADTSAINTNPAAMSLIQGTRFDVT